MGLALITGASSGLGLTFARKLAQSGHDVVLVARRKEILDDVAVEIAHHHKVHAEPLIADLATDAGIETVVKYIESVPFIDVLVNNAGFGTKGIFWEADVAGQEQMHRVHVMAIMRLTHAALRRMVTRKSGAVVNVSSVAAFTVGAGGVSYGATKGWINAFTKGLATELRVAGSPVKVQALCPGFTITEFHDTLGMNRGLVPKGLWLQADDVVNASLQALKTGKVIVVPGWKYKFTVSVLKHLPDFLMSRMGEATGRRMKRLNE
jgi:short-subunit dehydrogenase